MRRLSCVTASGNRRCARSNRAREAGSASVYASASLGVVATRAMRHSPSLGSHSIVRTTAAPRRNPMRRLALALVALVVAFGAVSEARAADSLLDKVKQKGEMIVGTKYDFPLFFYNTKAT